MIREIVEAVRPGTRVSVTTKWGGQYTGPVCDLGIAEDPDNPGADMDYMIVQEDGNVDCWIPASTIKSIEIYTEGKS